MREWPVHMIDEPRNESKYDILSAFPNARCHCDDNQLSITMYRSRFTFLFFLLSILMFGRSMGSRRGDKWRLWAGLTSGMWAYVVFDEYMTLCVWFVHATICRLFLSASTIEVLLECALGTRREGVRSLLHGGRWK